MIAYLMTQLLSKTVTSVLSSRSLLLRTSCFLGSFISRLLLRISSFTTVGAAKIHLPVLCSFLSTCGGGTLSRTWISSSGRLVLSQLGGRANFSPASEHKVHTSSRFSPAEFLRFPDFPQFFSSQISNYVFLKNES